MSSGVKVKRSLNTNYWGLTQRLDSLTNSARPLASYHRYNIIYKYPSTKGDETINSAPPTLGTLIFSQVQQAKERRKKKEKKRREREKRGRRNQERNQFLEAVIGDFCNQELKLVGEHMQLKGIYQTQRVLRIVDTVTVDCGGENVSWHTVRPKG
ncbi:uncharacterized protein LOC122091523 [Macadamia integrifolia]|uniref:uncharacterized protein LOC122091523 n=1 Tax=Macadamia integrifolia TaxID=60698 RepID=UPI001C4FA556|nr:uncharacterized protein LOC122091523 [Macadamia integrifolia]